MIPHPSEFLRACTSCVAIVLILLAVMHMSASTHRPRFVEILLFWDIAEKVLYALNDMSKSAQITLTMVLAVTKIVICHTLTGLDKSENTQPNRQMFLKAAFRSLEMAATVTC